MAIKPRLSNRQEMREEKVLPTRVLVHIKRDMAETLSDVVFDHEVDVLARIHGEENVNIVDNPMDFQVMIADKATLEKGREEMRKAARENSRVPAFQFIPAHPELAVFVGEELERLRNVYGRDVDEKKFFVDIVYPSERDLLEACGGAYVKTEKNAA